MKINKLISKKIAILGFWLEGKSTLNFLLKNWAKDVTILDKNKINSSIWMKSIIWEWYLNNLWDFDIIIKSPWISIYDEDIYPFREKITSQTQIFFDNYKWKVISVTATKWKSTISSLIYDLLKNANKNVELVWNIWKPVLDFFSYENWLFVENFDYIVYELSSYMLNNLNKKDYISILWNIFPDHLDRHLSFEIYKKAKLNILNNSEFSLVWYKIDEPITNIKFLSFWWKEWYYSYKNNYFYIDGRKIDVKIETKLIWEHNFNNITCLFWIADKLSIDYREVFKTIKEFKPLKHRLENIWIYNDIEFIDDSISTTPESTIEAMKTFWNKTWTIFLWWLDRWYDFSWLIEYLKLYRIKNIVLFPDSWVKIKESIGNNFNILETKSMNEAIRFTFKYTKKGSVCLLSTASPSYNLWKNFEEKWNEFKKYVTEYKS